MKFIRKPNKTLMIKKFIKVVNIINYFKSIIIHYHPNVYFYVFFISLDQYIIFYTKVAVFYFILFTITFTINIYVTRNITYTSIPINYYYYKYTNYTSYYT